MIFFKVLVILLISDSHEIVLPEGIPFQIPKTLKQVDEIVTMHLFAIMNCLDDSTENGTADGFGTDQIDGSSINCFWECVLTNIDMMKNGRLEYIGTEENKILKEAFDTCSKRDVMKVLEGCQLAHLFLLCEYRIFLEKATADIFAINEGLIRLITFAINSTSLIKDLKSKLDIINEHILKDPFIPIF